MIFNKDANHSALLTLKKLSTSGLYEWKSVNTHKASLVIYNQCGKEQINPWGWRITFLQVNMLLGFPQRSVGEYRQEECPYNGVDSWTSQEFMESQGSQMIGTGDSPESDMSTYMWPKNIISGDITSKISIFLLPEKNKTLLYFKFV